MKRYSESGEMLITFRVDGQPLPKQSFKMGANGGYTPERIKNWQKLVSYHARRAMNGRQPFEGALEVSITFWRKSGARVDLDNLSKSAMDSCNGVIWLDDQQVSALHLTKFVDARKPGLTVEVYRFTE